MLEANDIRAKRKLERIRKEKKKKSIYYKDEGASLETGQVFGADIETQ